MDASYYDRLVAEAVRGRKFVLAADVLEGSTRMVERLARQGAEGVFVVAGSRGVGDPPPAGFARWRVLGIGGDSIMDGIRRFEDALGDLPADVVAAIDEWDPGRSARVLREATAVDRPVAGRAGYGTRPEGWAQLEDKLAVDGLWDAAGVERAPSLVVPVSEAAASSYALAGELGTVWVGDNREGWHGGAEYLRWVRSEADVVAGEEFFAAHCDRVRVMPFLDGIPCSIHGMVIDDEVITFRPCELLILRRPNDTRLLYSGAGTLWDPPADDRAYMREMARRVGEHLRDEVGYRGAFNLDGVLTAAGWLPTELNARFAVGLGAVAGGLEFSLYQLHLMVVAGEPADFRPAELERVVVASGDANRSGGAGIPLTRVRNDTIEASLVFDGDHARFAGEDEEPHGSVAWGPSPSGSYLRMGLDPDHHEVGTSAAPKVARALALLDEEWGLGIGPVTAAPDARRPP